MYIQANRKRIVHVFLIGTFSLLIGVLYAQPSFAQPSRDDFRETAKELNLSRSQMMRTAGIVRRFNTEIESILTPDQLETLKLVREENQSQSQARYPQKLKNELDLTDSQVAQLTDAREDMVEELEEVLEPDQLEGMKQKIAFSNL